MPKALTAKGVEGQQPDPNRRLEIPDGLLPGLYLIVQTTGAKSWAVRFRANGRTAKVTLGRFPAIELAKVLEGRSFSPIGSGREVSFRGRLIAACGENQRGHFHAQPGLAQNADDQAGAENDRSDHRNLLARRQRDFLQSPNGSWKAQSESAVKKQ